MTRFLPRELNNSLCPTENAESAVNANHIRRAPNPGGKVQASRNFDRRPRNTRPVHLGFQVQPIKSPSITASQIGTTQIKMSTNVSITACASTISAIVSIHTSIFFLSLSSSFSPKSISVYVIGDLCTHARLRGEDEDENHAMAVTMRRTAGGGGRWWWDCNGLYFVFVFVSKGKLKEERGTKTTRS